VCRHNQRRKEPGHENSHQELMDHGKKEG
jgi:hypothetical protein